MNLQIQKRKEFHEHQEGHYRKHADGSGLHQKKHAVSFFCAMLRHSYKPQLNQVPNKRRCKRACPSIKEKCQFAKTIKDVGG